MKREFLKGLGVPEEAISKIMDENGNDVENAKKPLQAKIDDLTAKNTELTSKAEGYKDYEDLKKFKVDTLAEKENNQKKSYLESVGFKRTDLFYDKIDWSKAKYDEAKKTYTGVDVEGLKKTYAELYVEPNNQGKINFGNVGNGKTETPNPNSSMNNFIRGIK